jgi:hypothetical protein
MWMKKQISGSDMLRKLERSMRREQKILVKTVYSPNFFRVMVREEACAVPRPLWDAFCRSAEQYLKEIADWEQYRLLGKSVRVEIVPTDKQAGQTLAVQTAFTSLANTRSDSPGSRASQIVEYRLQDDSLIIGREDADIVLRDAARRISRRHARIFRNGTGYKIEDLLSANGTSVNGKALNAPQLLQPGDTLRFADAEFIYVVEEDGPKLVGTCKGTSQS